MARLGPGPDSPLNVGDSKQEDFIKKTEDTMPMDKCPKRQKRVQDIDAEDISAIDSKKRDYIKKAEDVVGISGIILMIKLIDFIPAAFKRHRINHIRDILTSALSLDPKELSASDVGHFIDSMDSSHSKVIEWKQIADFTGPVSEDILWETTLKFGKSYNKFLAPPTDTCFQCGSSLQLHHEPTTVICISLKGP
uniref:Uncharacterized protein n=1 Tax=Amphimedon queenslandica TaxID=400682 RepID=A0A1X7SHJ6_AMPQE